MRGPRQEVREGSVSICPGAGRGRPSNRFCQCLSFSVGFVWVNYYCHCLAEAGGDTLVVLLAEVCGSEVGGDERGQLVGVAVFQQFYDGTEAVAVLHDLGRFAAHVLDGKDGVLALGLVGLVVPGNLQQVACVGYLHAHFLRAVSCVYEGVGGLLQGIERCGLAVAEGSAEDCSGPVPGIGTEARQFPQAHLDVAVVLVGPSTLCHLQFVCGLEEVEGILGGEVPLKTRCCSP